MENFLFELNQIFKDNNFYNLNKNQFVVSPVVDSVIAIGNIETTKQENQPNHIFTWWNGSFILQNISDTKWNSTRVRKNCEYCSIWAAI